MIAMTADGYEVDVSGKLVELYIVLDECSVHGCQSAPFYDQYWSIRLANDRVLPLDTVYYRREAAYRELARRLAHTANRLIVKSREALNAAVN